MQRFFVPADWLGTGNVTVTGPLVHRMRDVLRMRVGERVTFLDNSGWEYEAELTSVGHDAVEAVVRRKSLGVGEPRTKITLYQSLLKGDHFAFVLQKCTELGVVEFVPVVSERCIVGDANEASARFHRWQRIILEAAEQSHRAKFPVLRPATLLRAAFQRVTGKGLSLIPWEEEKTTTVRAALSGGASPPAGGLGKKAEADGQRGLPRRPFAINVFIGPEGGFTPAEIASAINYGLVPVTLGPRILRAETAGLVTAAVVLYELGDLG